jgi:carboxypeptidase Q
MTSLSELARSPGFKSTSVAVAAALALAGGTLGARQAKEPVDQAAIAKIRNEALNRSQVGALFSMLTDGIGPRLTGSPEHKRAADWARQTMAGWGLSNARLEPWEFGRGWTLDKLTIEMIEPRYMPLLGYAEAWSPSTPGELIVPAVFVAGKSPEELAAMPAQLKGAAVLQTAIVTNFIATDRVQPALQPDAPPADPATPAQRQGAAGRQGSAGGRQGGPSAVQAIGAAGGAVLLRASRGMHGTVFLASGRDNAADPLPKIMLAGEHYNMIARMLERKIVVKLRVNVQTRFHDQDRNTYNILAELPGTDPVLKDQVVMLGAHLDSWHTGTGATDNADGSAVAMEAFRILKATGLATRRTLRLALWSGEEQGLLGARAYVRAHLAGDANKGARDRMSVYFNIDPGKGPIYGWYLQNNDAVKPIFDAWLAPFQDKASGAIKNVRQGIGSTDHLAFIEAGVPGFNPIQDYVDYDVREHHTNADLVERVKEADLRQNAMILAAFVYHAAMRAEMIPSPVRK